MGWETKFCPDQAPPILALYMRRFRSKAQKEVYSNPSKTNLDYSVVKIQFSNFFANVILKLIFGYWELPWRIYA